MQTTSIIAILCIYCLPCQLVYGQFGVYFDPNISRNRYYSPLPCTVNNFYDNTKYNARTRTYTLRQDSNCCIVQESRNRCCQESSYNYATRTVDKICRCSSSTSCGLPTTTTPTVTTPTTTTPPTVPTTPCPVVTTPSTPPPTTAAPFCPSMTGRILNSQSVPDLCGDYPGVFPVVRRSADPNIPDIAVCNTVFAQSVVNGVRKMTLVTTEFCRKITEAGGSALLLKVSDTVTIPTTDFTMTDSTDGAAFFDFNDKAITDKLTSSCKKSACGLFLPEMTGRINYNQCKVLSFGSYEETTLAQKGLRQVDVRISPQGCNSLVKYLSNDPMCFSTNDGRPLICSGDYGAPVYCKTTNTGENVVVGMIAGNTDCGKTSTFYVVKYPVE